jgi:hypothetical protein
MLLVTTLTLGEVGAKQKKKWVRNKLRQEINRKYWGNEKEALLG